MLLLAACAMTAAMSDHELWACYAAALALVRIQAAAYYGAPPWLLLLLSCSTLPLALQVVPPSMPQDYTTLMEHAWATDPAERPTAQQLVECLNHIAGSRIAALQAGGDSAAGSAVAAAATAAPVVRKTADELLGNPSKRQVQREQQQQKLLKAASVKSANASRRFSLTIEDGEEPGDVGSDDGLATANPANVRRPNSGSGVRGFFNMLTGNSSSNNIAGGSKPSSRDHSKELPSVSHSKELPGGLSPLSGAGGQAQWFV
jgi:hypothetical protein